MKKFLNINFIVGLLELLFCGHYIAHENYLYGGLAVVIAILSFVNFYLNLKNKKGSQ
jgi:hypothetical protein